MYFIHTEKTQKMLFDIIESQGYLLFIEGKVNEQTVIIIFEESFISRIFQKTNIKQSNQESLKSESSHNQDLRVEEI